MKALVIFHIRPLQTWKRKFIYNQYVFFICFYRWRSAQNAAVTWRRSAWFELISGNGLTARKARKASALCQQKSGCCAPTWADRKQEEGSSKDLWSLMLVKTWLCTKRCHFVVRINWVWRVRCALLAEDKAALSSVGMKMVNLFTVSCGFDIDLGPNCISWKRLSSPGPSGNIHSWKNPTTVTCWSGAGCVTRPDTALQAPQCSWRSSSCSCGVR